MPAQLAARGLHADAGADRDAHAHSQPDADPRADARSRTRTATAANDLADQCVDEAGWGFAPWFGGCPPPLAAKVAGALAGAGLLAFLGFYVAPMAMVMTVRQPPAGYVQVYRNGKAEGSYKSLRSLGQSARKSTITIGSKGLLKVPGMEPVELRVERRGQRIRACCAGRTARSCSRSGRSRRCTPRPAGNGIVLKFSTDPKQLDRAAEPCYTRQGTRLASLRLQARMVRPLPGKL